MFILHIVKENIEGIKMSNKCIGLFGKIFGHSFESMIVKYNLPNFKKFSLNGNIDVRRIADKKCRIICRRCGKEIN